MTFNLHPLCLIITKGLMIAGATLATIYFPSIYLNIVLGLVIALYIWVVYNNIRLMK
jgi:hypothetical protein